MVAGHLQTKKGYYYMAGAEFEIRRWQSQVQMDFNRDTGNWEEKCKVGGRNVSRNQMHL